MSSVLGFQLYPMLSWVVPWDLETVTTSLSLVVVVVWSSWRFSTVARLGILFWISRGWVMSVWYLVSFHLDFCLETTRRCC